MERVIGIRFAELPPDAEDAILGAVETIRQIYQLEPPIITFGDPPLAAAIPSVEQIEQIILMEE